MLLGKELGPYVVEKELGNGAMGTVFRARHKASGDKVAVKLISPAVASSEAALARFQRECAILKQLQHPHIVRYLGSGRFHGAPFYIMEYVEGESLDHVMARRGRMTWEEVADLGVQLCAALQHSHDMGIIHRDLKPSNLMVLRDGTVKLTDFGIAKDVDVTALTAMNATVGTAAYMSPEQCRGARDLTYRSDLYSMGIMFYELITGRKPYVAETAMEMFMKHTKGDFTRPSRLVLDLPVWLDTLICQLMEKKPEQRPLNAHAVATALHMVREKVTALQSAGVDTAKKRRIDRSTHDVAVDETDKEAARALLGKKKKKKKGKPFYQQNWFTIAALGVIAVVFLAFIYVVFLKPPDAEALYTQIAAAMNSKDEEKWRALRGPDGEIGRFLYYHPQHPKGHQVQRWSDEIDASVREGQMNRRRKINSVMEGPDKEAEKSAREALDLEELGNLDDAARRWRDVAGYRDSKDADVRAWGLLGDKRLKEVEAVDGLAVDLKNKVIGEKILKKPAETNQIVDKLALDAVRAEDANRTTAARKSWEELKQLAENQPENRRYYLLANRRLREMSQERDRKEDREK